MFTALGLHNVSDDFQAADWWERTRIALSQYLDAGRQAKARPVPPDDAEERILRRAAQKLDLGKTRKKKPPVILAKPDDFRPRYETLKQMGGKLVGLNVIFGTPDEMQIEFQPKSDGGMSVGYRADVTDDALKAKLNRGGGRLWDADSNRPGKEYRAIAEAIYIRDWLADCAYREELNQLPPRQLAPGSSEDSPTFLGIKPPQQAEQKEVPSEPPSLVAIHSALSDLLSVCESKKLALASQFFKTFSATGTESSDVKQLRICAVDLAMKLQKPPSKQELREAIKWDDRKFNKELPAFADILKKAGLAWLPKAKPTKA